MSRWGRAQDALYWVLMEHEVSSMGDKEPGLLTGKISDREIHDLIDPILEAVAGPLGYYNGPSDGPSSAVTDVAN